MENVSTKSLIGKDLTCKFCGNPYPVSKIKHVHGSWFLRRAKHCKFCNQSLDGWRQQSRAQAMANQYQELLMIAYECPCETKDKIKHHPDYSQPYLVVLLCDPCHHSEHRRINTYKEGEPSFGASAGSRSRNYQFIRNLIRWATA